MRWNGTLECFRDEYQKVTLTIPNCDEHRSQRRGEKKVNEVLRIRFWPRSMGTGNSRSSTAGHFWIFADIKWVKRSTSVITINTDEGYNFPQVKVIIIEMKKNKELFSILSKWIHCFNIYLILAIYDPERVFPLGEATYYQQNPSFSTLLWIN